MKWLPGKPYYAVRLSDIPENAVIMGNCFVCGHRDGLNKYALAKRWHPMSHWSTIDKYLRCTKCGNKLCNSFSFEIVEETR